MRRFLLLVGLIIGLGAAGPTVPSPPPAADFLTILDQLKSDTPMAASCCKVCRKGKACGDSCIRQNYNCHKGVGCACDG